MSFKQVLSQMQAVRSFQRALAKGCLAHAYIFHGSEGVGKALFAKEASKALLCQEGGEDACERCTHCLRVESRTHPDLYWLTLGKEKKFIAIDDIRNLQVFAALKPFEARRRVFIIQDADRMNEEASNSLLKTLEEPPPSVVILLVATSLQLLRKTIISRCQVMRFHPLPSNVLRELLESRGIKGGELEWLVVASGGSPGRALRLKEEGAYPRRRRLIERLTSLSLEDNFSLSKELLEWCPGDELEERRSRLGDWLGVILEYYRDILFSSVGVDLPLFNQDSAPLIQRKAIQLSQTKVMGIMEEVLDSLEGLHYNANITLLLEDMFSRIARLESRN